MLCTICYKDCVCSKLAIYVANTQVTGYHLYVHHHVQNRQDVLTLDTLFCDILLTERCTKDLMKVFKSHEGNLNFLLETLAFLLKDALFHSLTFRGHKMLGRPIYIIIILYI